MVNLEKRAQSCDSAAKTNSQGRKKYILIGVCFSSGDRVYEYFADSEDYGIGETIIVPGSRGDTPVVVQSVRRADESELPVPLYRMKHVVTPPRGERGQADQGSDASRSRVKTACQGEKETREYPQNLDKKSRDAAGSQPQRSPKASPGKGQSVRDRAEAGDAEAQCELGVRYYRGEGVPRDFALAREWFLKAAVQDSARAQCNLGVMSFKGEGVPKDAVRAAEWYGKAAARGYALAQLNLGWMYENGLGVKKDLSRAREWYQKAADQGLDQARKGLERLGALLNPAQGKASSQDAVFQDTPSRDTSPRNPSSGENAPQNDAPQSPVRQEEPEQPEPDQVVSRQTEAPQTSAENAGTGQRKGKRFALLAACILAFVMSLPLWHAGTQFSLGTMRGEGRFFQKNDQKAAEWYLKSAAQGHARAQYKLGEMYEKGEGGRKNHAVAAEWYAKACENGHRAACLRQEALARARSAGNSAQSQARPDAVRAKSPGAMRPNAAGQAELEREAEKLINSALQ